MFKIEDNKSPNPASDNKQTDDKEKEVPHQAELYAAIYARISSNSGKNNSKETQEEEARKRISDAGLLLYRVYKDEHSAKQARYRERKGFMQLMTDLQAGMFKTVVLYKRDRLTRRTDDYIELKHIFQKHHVRLLYTKEPDQDLESDYISTFVDNMIFAIGSLEPDRINQRTSGGKVVSRMKGKYNSGQHVPIGYTKDISEMDQDFKHNSDMTKCTYYPKKRYWKLIESIFQTCLKVTDEGPFTIKSLVEETNELSKSLEINEPIKRNKIEGVIFNPIYAAQQTNDLKLSKDKIYIFDEESKQYVIHEEIIQDSTVVIPIVSIDLWKQASLHMKNILYKEKCKKNNKDYFLKGKLYCHQCEKKIEMTGGEYYCRKKCAQISYDDLVRILREKVINDINHEVIYKQIEKIIKDMKNRQQELKSEYAKNEAKKREITLSYLAGDNYPSINIDVENFNKNRTKIKNEISSAGEQVLYFYKLQQNISQLKSDLQKFYTNTDKQSILVENLESIISKVVLSYSRDDQKPQIKQVKYNYK